VTLGRVLDDLPYSLPDAMAQALIDVLREINATLSAGVAPPEQWLYALIPAARRLPAHYLLSALEQFPVPRIEEPKLRRWQTVLDFVMETLQIRQRLFEELNI
jgi:hypothetical protein